MLVYHCKHICWRSFMSLYDIKWFVIWLEITAMYCTVFHCTAPHHSIKRNFAIKATHIFFVEVTQSGLHPGISLISIN